MGIRALLFFDDRRGSPIKIKRRIKIRKRSKSKSKIMSRIASQKSYWGCGRRTRYVRLGLDAAAVTAWARPAPRPRRPGGTAARRLTLGPSPEFKKASTWLTDAVKITSPESLKTRGGRKVLKNTPKGKGATPGKPGATRGTSKGSRAASAGPEVSKGRPD
jgi:hypothetical protein